MTCLDKTGLAYFWSKIKIALNDLLEQAKANGDFTPRKGVDYFTEEDKQELVSAVLDELPQWQGGSY